jgi:hypothetical protein
MIKNDVPREKILAFKVIKNTLDEALEALKQRIDREWPNNLATIPGARVLFLTMVKVAINTYQSILFLAADIPKEDSPPLEFALSIPPLTRSLLDQLFATIFLAEDLNKRTQWYYKSGWREARETYDRYKAKYGKDSKWAEWLELNGKFLESIRTEWGVSEKEAADLRRIKYWPIPSKMKEKAKDRVFLKYLDDWFYKTLSQDAHLSFPGLVHRGSALLLKPGSGERKEQLARRKSVAVATTITIMLALASEMEHHLRFGSQERLIYVWNVLIKYWEEAEELYKMRYEQFLTEQGEGIVEGRHHTP